MTLAGTPPTNAPAGTSLLTSEQAETTAPSPMITPGSMVAFAPIRTFFPMTIPASPVRIR